MRLRGGFWCVCVMGGCVCLLSKPWEQGALRGVARQGVRASNNTYVVAFHPNTLPSRENPSPSPLFPSFFSPLTVPPPRVCACQQCGLWDYCPLSASVSHQLWTCLKLIVSAEDNSHAAITVASSRSAVLGSRAETEYNFENSDFMIKKKKNCAFVCFCYRIRSL